MAFRLKCKKELYENLGRYDAIVEFTEIAVRDFIAKSQKSKNFDTYLQEKSVEHEIKVDTIDLDLYQTRIAHSYIISVYQSFELFLRTFKDEYCELYDVNWTLPDNKENLLLKIISKVSSLTKAKDEIGESNIELFDYYRIIRNKYVHEHISQGKIEKAHKEITKQKTNLSSLYPKLNAPNKFTEISFDDFIIFTRAVKTISKGLCKLIKPKSEQIFADFYIREKMYKSFNDKPERKIGAITNDLKFRFGITENTDLIIEKIMYQ
jgi:hypothetical protein